MSIIFVLQVILLFVSSNQRRIRISLDFELKCKKSETIVIVSFDLYYLHFFF